MEVAGEVGELRVPVVAVGHQHRAVALRRRRAAAARRRHLPLAAVRRTYVLDRGLEADQGTHAEVVHVVLEVAQDLAVVGIVGVVVGHRIVGVGHPRLRGVDVERLVGRREPVVVAVAPVAADPGALLEADARDAVLPERLGRRDPRGAGADDRDFPCRHRGRDSLVERLAIQASRRTGKIPSLWHFSSSTSPWRSASPSCARSWRRCC